MSEELWQRRLDRERQARKTAEQLLTEKSRELYQSTVELKQALAASEDQRRLQLALWGSGELIWEWTAQDNLMRLHFSPANRAKPCAKPCPGPSVCNACTLTIKLQPCATGMTISAVIATTTTWSFACAARPTMLGTG